MCIYTKTAARITPAAALPYSNFTNLKLSAGSVACVLNRLVEPFGILIL